MLFQVLNGTVRRVLVVDVQVLEHTMHELVLVETVEDVLIDVA
jgi:hypothetical protein